MVIFSACSDSQRSGPEPYFSRTMPPRKQEFRWSNGRTPKSLDPALAAAPPETDLVRAVYEGLTEIDARTLEAIPAVAEKWTASEDLKTWTFQLRSDARWSKGQPVTARDFVRSWKRLGRLGDSVAHHELLTNIIGFPVATKKPVVPPPLGTPDAGNLSLPISPIVPRNTPPEGHNSNAAPADPRPDKDDVDAPGVSAPDARTLRVQLIVPDKDFPELVANPIFRPVFGEGEDIAGNSINTEAVTNGAFRVGAVAAEGVTLERSETYWNRGAVKIERVQLVSKQNAEK